MPTPELEEFAQRLVEFVRDHAITSSNVMLNPNAKGLRAKRLRDAAQICTPVEFARLVIPEVVDTTVFFLLNAIDNDHLKLTYTASNGKTVDWVPDADNGGLGGWYASGEWPAKYSEHPYIDDEGNLPPPESE
jgi:hypothetical protein